MADSTEHYRGYEIALYHKGRPNVRAMIRESNGLPPIHDWPLEKSVDVAREKARELIDQKLATLNSN